MHCLSWTMACSMGKLLQQLLCSRAIRDFLNKSGCDNFDWLSVVQPTPQSVIENRSAELTRQIM